MDKTETLEELYKRKFEWLPENIRNDIGHFNVFQLQPLAGKPIPYKRRDYYKIMLVIGHSQVHYADKVIEVKKAGIVFFQSPHSLQVGTPRRGTGRLLLHIQPTFFLSKRRSAIRQFESV